MKQAPFYTMDMVSFDYFNYIEKNFFKKGGWSIGRGVKNKEKKAEKKIKLINSLQFATKKINVGFGTIINTNEKKDKLILVGLIRKR